jgi:hypothetical protein
MRRIPPTIYAPISFDAVVGSVREVQFWGAGDCLVEALIWEAQGEVRRAHRATFYATADFKDGTILVAPRCAICLTHPTTRLSGDRSVPLCACCDSPNGTEVTLEEAAARIQVPVALIDSALFDDALSKLWWVPSAYAPDGTLLCLPHVAPID